MFNPRRYSQNLGPFVNWTKIAYEKQRHLLKWNSEPESILDIGIGDGRMTKEVILPLIPKNIKEYVGADISETMLNYAKGIINHEKFTTAFVDIKANSVPVEMQNRFDHVFCSYLLHHVQDTRLV